MSIDDLFADFHRRHPEIYQTLKSTAAKWVARGARRISVRALYEVARMNHWLSTTSGEPWTLNNNYTSRYARMLAAEPELKGKIELRAIKGQPAVEPDDIDLDF